MNRKIEKETELDDLHNIEKPINWNKDNISVENEKSHCVV